MDALTIISQAGPSPSGSGAPLGAGMLFTIMAACATSALLALIVARGLNLHRSRAIRRSAIGRDRPAAMIQPSPAGLIEPKPLHQQRAARS